MKAAESGNLPNWGNHSSVASYFDNFTSKTAKTLMKLTVESDSQANQRNQTKVLPVTIALKQKAVSLEQTINLCL